MSKKQAARTRTSATVAADVDVPVVGMREPCPCGSGRRYKACHGRSAAAVLTSPARPFAGFASEADIVAMREIVPAATAPLALTGANAGRAVTLATVLPMAWPALVRADGTVMVGLQVNVGSGDASRDLGDVLVAALDADAGEPVALGRVTADSPRMQDLVDPDLPLDITVHDDFEFWFDATEEMSDDIRTSLERTKRYAHPTVRLSSVTAGYWTQMGDKEFLRWMLPHEEEPLLDALARLRAAGRDSLGDEMRLIGMFRADGLVCPVWDLPFGSGAESVEEPVAVFGERLAEALAVSEPLTSAERGARAGLANRQVTLR